jgi:hypothetical protein
MVNTRSFTDLADTALVIECMTCRSAYVLNPGTQWAFQQTTCFACNTHLENLGVLVDSYRTFQMAVAQARGANIRISVGIAPS